MKKYIIILAAVACALCACQKHEIELLDKPIIEQIDGNTYTYTFSAVISDNVSAVEEDGTKATVSRAGAFAWAVDDELKFFKSDNTFANAKITAVDGSTATITVYDVDSRADFVTAIYPASAAVSKNQISFNARGPIVVADIAGGGTLTFHHIGSLINLKFYDISGLTSIKSLVFEPASAFNYDGSFTFDGSHVPSLTEKGSTAKIVVPASSSDNNSDITVVVPSVNLSGFSAALNSESNGSGRNLFKKSTATARDLATSRPVLMNMKRVAYEAPRFYYISTTGISHTASYLPMIKTGSTMYQINLQMDASATYKIYDEFNKDNASEYVANGTFVPTLEGDNDDYYIIGTMERADWDKYNGDYRMKRVQGTDWCFCKNVKFRATSAAFKIYTDLGNWDAVSYNSASVSVGTEGAIAAHSTGGGDNTVSVSTSSYYDVFLNTAESRIIIVLSSENYNPISNNVAGIHSVIYNSSDGSVNLYRNYDNRDNPWNDSNVKTKLRIIGYTSGWTGQNDELTLTYDGNEGWYYRNLIITADGSKEFKFKINGDNYSSYYNWGLKDSQSVNAGTNNYGAAVAQDATGNNTITLSRGTYDVYLNAFSWYDNKKMNYMFIKH